jgi:hypothetical protein
MRTKVLFASELRPGDTTPDGYVYTGWVESATRGGFAHFRSASGEHVRIKCLRNMPFEVLDSSNDSPSDLSV